MKLDKQKVASLRKMYQEWDAFKYRRHSGQYQTSIKEGFLTILDRENMLNEMFKLLFQKSVR